MIWSLLRVKYNIFSKIIVYENVQKKREIYFFDIKEYDPRFSHEA